MTLKNDMTDTSCAIFRLNACWKHNSVPMPITKKYIIRIDQIDQAVKYIYVYLFHLVLIYIFLFNAWKSVILSFM